MKIVTWNCNGALRKKFEQLKSLNADIYIIQECENPFEVKHKEYFNWANNHLWIGDNKNKGIGIFANSDIKLQKLDWSDNFKGHKVKYFLPCSVNNEFELLAIWAHSNNSPTFGYIGQFWKYLQVNKGYLNKSLIVGDLNSNKIWDKWDRWWNHSDVIKELNDIEIESFYHKFYNEEQGKESLPTFFLHRSLEKPYHIDYVFGSKYFSSNLKNIEIGNIEKWLEISDHLPLICEFSELNN
ncbi:endonuclease/exonuclease/phosphatase family protein [Flavobacterium sufflavum]|uniref:Endonuclease/exonuclease/phosphatase family protein n=1 Tax=Flavobacterium sufflavum TaxID=1921138 RepID=A0A437L3L4_9FLAO|nr:endonuclease/exonuclease/phosphatase family protein [Flavobacterium sufflavum]RVT79904.1 endonuclease/exonuclease/phosphatase family protein [Flavobacterium sufflavum]